MENFTPYTAFAGGILIGLSVTIMLLFNGRVTGISGMLSGLLTLKVGEWVSNLVFLLGMIMAVFIFNQFFPNTFSLRTDFPVSLLIIGGFLVGFGTRMGGGCTSGHGICGISRLSLRSVIATVIFMFSGAISVFIIRHLIGINP